MDRQEGARWDVGIKDDAVYLERISDADKRLFDDSLAPEEARALAGLLTKYADKLGDSDDSEDADQSEDSNESDSEDSEDSDDSEDSEDSDDSDKSSD
jgi:hypothetical protein